MQDIPVLDTNQNILYALMLLMNFHFINSQEDVFDKVYMKPYSRIAPYLIGVLTGYILWKSERRVKMPKVSIRSML
jgi:hypothetical protein